MRSSSRSRTWSARRTTSRPPSSWPRKPRPTEFDDEIRAAAKQAEADFAAFEIRSMLSGPNDHCNAFLTIHAGAGGTEACDWAEMLLRMYLMWAESKGFKTEITDREEGGAAGHPGGERPHQGRVRLRLSPRRDGRPPAGPDQPVRFRGAPAYLVRLGGRPARSR